MKRTILAAIAALSISLSFSGCAKKPEPEVKKEIVYVQQRCPCLSMFPGADTDTRGKLLSLQAREYNTIYCKKENG